MATFLQLKYLRSATQARLGMVSGELTLKNSGNRVLSDSRGVPAPYATWKKISYKMLDHGDPTPG